MLFSIIVPVYNVELYLIECIESILSQSYVDFELILVNDGSTDNSGQICNQYMGDGRVKVIHKQNEGHTLARREGLRNARGEYICFVDSDDYIDGDLLKNFSNIINVFSPEVIVVDYVKFGEEQQSIIFNNTSEGIYVGHDLAVLKECLIYNKAQGGINGGCIVWGAGGKCYKKNVIEKYLLKVDKSIILGEDMVMNIPLLYNSHSIYVKRYNGYYYRNNPNSIVNNYRVTDFEQDKVVVSSLDKELKNHYMQLSYYLFIRLCDYAIKSVKNGTTLKEFRKLMNQNYTREEYNRFKKIKIRNVPWKQKGLYFLLKKRAWTIIWFRFKKGNK